jgi:hypothetical protein
MPTPAAKAFRASQAEIESAQMRFDWLIPFQTKQKLTTAEAAQCLARGEDFVRELVEQGRLEAFGDSAFGTRESLRITRRSIVVHLARTAKSDPDDFVAAFIDVAARMSAVGRKKLIAALQLTFR